MKGPRCFTVLALLLTAGFSVAPLAAQKAHSIPISNQVIVLELTHPDGEVTKAAVREGAMLQIRDTAADWHFGFTPVLDEKQEVLVTVFRITEGPSDHEMLREVAKEKAGIAEKTSVAISQGFNLRVLRVFEAPFDSEDEPIRDPISARPEG